MRILVALAAVLLLAAPAGAQRDRAQLGEGFAAVVVRALREHPVESAGGAAAAAGVGVAAYRALRGAKKEEDGNG